MRILLLTAGRAEMGCQAVEKGRISRMNTACGAEIQCQAVEKGRGSKITTARRVEYQPSGGKDMGESPIAYRQALKRVQASGK